MSKEQEVVKLKEQLQHEQHRAMKWGGAIHQKIKLMVAELHTAITIIKYQCDEFG
jgi:hypothetical protein